MGLENSVNAYHSVADQEAQQLAVRDAVVGNPNDSLVPPTDETDAETRAKPTTPPEEAEVPDVNSEAQLESTEAPQPDKTASDSAPASKKSSGK